MPFSNPQWLSERMLLLIPLLLSLGVHEWAHAWAAFRLGDDTAARLGRLSLNPFVHVDPVGTFILPLLGVPFGWAKPVPFNPLRFSRRFSMSTGTMLTALAGPFSNLVLAALSVLLLTILAKSGAAPAGGPLQALLQNLVFLNIILAAFNMIPVPPLDGSHVIDALLPKALRPYWDPIYRFGPFGVIAVVLLLQLSGLNLFGWALNLAAALVQAAG